MQRGRGLGREQSDPMSVLDRAMDETIQELDRSGQGVEVEDVARAPRTPAREPGGRTRAADERERDDQGRFVPQRRRPARSAPVLDDRDDDDTDVFGTFADDDDEDDEPTPRRRTQTARRSTRSTVTDEDEDDDDVDDDEDEDLEDEDEDEAPRRSGGRRLRDADEEAEDDEDDDLDLGPEDARGAEDDEDEDEDRQPRRQSRRRRKRLPREVQKVVNREVEKRVAKVVEERDALRQQQQQQQADESKALEFLIKAIGTQEERQRLQGIVNDTRRRIEERNQAAALLTRYQANEGYAQQYRTALLAHLRQTEANEVAQVQGKFKEYGIALDPKVLAEGHRAKILFHVAHQAVMTERARAQKVIEKLERRLATSRGVRTERSVRNGTGRSRPNGTMASGSGRRANGRHPSRSMPRGSLEKGRGIAANSQVVFPSDEVLAGLRNGEMSLADLRL